MTTMPRISIVTPSYNHGQFIENAIQSVLNQNYPNFEHIIIDNCSTDCTLNVLRKYSHLTWISEPDRGQSDALNKGFRRATGDIIGWLNADDYYLPGAFQKVVAFWEGHPEADVVYGGCQYVDESGKFTRNYTPINFNRRILLYRFYIPSTATFIKRAIFYEGNFIDINFHYIMDREFFTRLALHRKKFLHIRDILAAFRWHDDNKSLNKPKIGEEYMRVLDMYDGGSTFRRKARYYLIVFYRWKYRWQKLIEGGYLVDRYKPAK